MKRSSASMDPVPSESADKRVRRRPLALLIHAVDGCVPFLTPTILEQYFPPAEDFWIGLSVRDTCVVSASDLLDDATEQGPKKNRGFAFTSTASPDPWLLPYRRVTVPSFNLVHDMQSMKRGQAEKDVLSTDKEVHMWTFNGRQALSPEMFAKASMSLDSHATLSLYDMTCTDSARRQKKAEARCVQWFKVIRDFLSGKDRELWFPLLIPPDGGTCQIDESLLRENQNNMGMALIGTWHNSLDLGDLGNRSIAVLSTESIRQILDIASSGCIDIVGTDLPRLWTLRSRAFVLCIDDEESSPGGFVIDEDGCASMESDFLSRDQRGLIEGCDCLACSDNRFNRAYIHHLVCAKEIVAQTLLFSHNLHHLLRMIRTISTATDPAAYISLLISRLDNQSCEP